MKIKPNYFVIPLITIATATVGSAITSAGMNWYRTINLPPIAPPGSYIGLVWTIIFILTTIATLIVWNEKKRRNDFNVIIWLLIANALLNVYWSVLFFGWHYLGLAIWEMLLLNLTNLLLIIRLWRKNRSAALLLIPYFLWVCFATYLAYQIYMIN